MHCFFLFGFFDYIISRKREKCNPYLRGILPRTKKGYIGGRARAGEAVLCIRRPLIGQSQDVIGGGLIKPCQRDQAGERQLPLLGFVLGICVLLDVQIPCNLCLREIVVFSQISDSHIGPLFRFCIIIIPHLELRY